MTLLDFNKDKKISMVTCYDYTTARIVAESDVDCILVGDSVSMVVYGAETTLEATVEMMVAHVQAVKRGSGSKFVVGDLPFLSFRKGLENAMEAVEKIMRAGADAVKLEGVRGNEAIIEHIVESGIPVMGHLGLTPQSVRGFGGFKVQGKCDESAAEIVEGAKVLEALGCFATVLECIPAAVAEAVTEAVNIPTIGIGAGAATDGQVLVMPDLLGMNVDFKPKFVKEFANGHDVVKDALNQYAREVACGEFPTKEHTYKSKAKKGVAA